MRFPGLTAGLMLPAVSAAPLPKCTSILSHEERVSYIIIMSMHAFKLVLLPLLLPLVVNTCLYLAVFKWRKHKVSFQTCVVLAAAPVISSSVLPLPTVVSLIAGVALAWYVLDHYSDVEMMPEGLLIIFGVEFTFAFLDRFVITPLI